MPNTLLTPTMITREALRVLHNNLVFVKGVNRQYSSEFAISGAKIGSTVNVRKPNRYYVRTGPTMQTQNTSETFVPLTLNRQWGVDVNFSSAELTLSLDDFSKRILTTAMANVSSQIDYEGLGLFNQVWNLVGAAGTSPGAGAAANTTLQSAFQVQPYLNAGLMLDVNATPRDENRRVVLNPSGMAATAGALTGLFQDSGLVAEQYRKGVLGVALGFEFALDQNVQGQTMGSRAGTPVVDGANQTGAVLNTRGWTANTTINAGEVFSVVGVTGVNPENQQVWNIPAVTAANGSQNFVVLANATADSTGRMALSIAPNIKLIGATIPDGTVANLAADGAALTYGGAAAGTWTANATYPQSLAYHQDAFTLATVDLELPQGVDFAAREVYDGISMRIVRAFDINNDQFPCRIDVLGGWACLRPEMACRITG